MSESKQNEALEQYIESRWNNQTVKQAYPRAEDRRAALTRNYELLHKDAAEPAPSATGPVTLASLKGEIDVTGSESKTEAKTESAGQGDDEPKLDDDVGGSVAVEETSDDDESSD